MEIVSDFADRADASNVIVNGDRFGAVGKAAAFELNAGGYIVAPLNLPETPAFARITREVRPRRKQRRTQTRTFDGERLSGQHWRQCSLADNAVSPARDELNLLTTSPNLSQELVQNDDEGRRYINKRWAPVFVFDCVVRAETLEGHSP
ncbi:hypothetical protein [Ensifer sp. YR511]|uniref:hypothetical protein n=1 Tax=Ensifer sp. YR511 TaxID=1855294 RepID=UPI000885310D|nr:hypothetical protein [Ensifer sp. YR511]SDN97378.1 hypothetical protein SAMN05216328_14521 [Ensifer sp. YR511]